MAERSSRGQTLVELALVLPCFCLGVFMAVQLICYCHNMIELERMAQLMIDRVTYQNYRATKPYYLFNSLWGRFVPPLCHFSTSLSKPWRPFSGLSTIQKEGRTFQMHIETHLLPSAGF